MCSITQLSGFLSNYSKLHSSHGMLQFDVHRSNPPLQKFWHSSLFELNLVHPANWQLVIFKFEGNKKKSICCFILIFISLAGEFVRYACHENLCNLRNITKHFSSFCSFVNYTHVDRNKNIFSTNKNNSSSSSNKQHQQ